MSAEGLDGDGMDAVDEVGPLRRASSARCPSGGSTGGGARPASSRRTIFERSYSRKPRRVRNATDSGRASETGMCSAVLPGRDARSEIGLNSSCPMPRRRASATTSTVAQNPSNSGG